MEGEKERGCGCFRPQAKNAEGIELRKHIIRISSEIWLNLSKKIKVGMIGRIRYLFSKSQNTQFFIHLTYRISIIITEGGPRK